MCIHFTAILHSRLIPERIHSISLRSGDQHESHETRVVFACLGGTLYTFLNSIRLSVGHFVYLFTRYVDVYGALCKKSMWNWHVCGALFLGGTLHTISRGICMSVGHFAHLLFLSRGICMSGKHLVSFLRGIRMSENTLYHLYIVSVCLGCIFIWYSHVWVALCVRFDAVIACLGGTL